MRMSKICAYQSLTGRCPWSPQRLYVTFLSEIFPTDEANLSRIALKERGLVRQGDKNGLRSVFDIGRRPEIMPFTQNMRSLGTPIFGFSYLKMFLEALEDNIRCY